MKMPPFIRDKAQTSFTLPNVQIGKKGSKACVSPWVLTVSILLLTTGLSACQRSAESTTVNAVTLTQKPGSDPSSSASTTAAKVAATIDDQVIYENELVPLMQGGVDRAIALDRAINRVVTAKAARLQYQQEAQTAVENASREVLSQLYLQRATQRLSERIKDEDIRAWYERRIKADDYREYQATYVLLASPEEAARVAAEALQGDRKALMKFKPITDQPDQWLKAGDFPYGLGQIVNKMKTGDISKPIALRNGWFVLMLRQTREHSPPALDSVKNEIRNILVAEALVQDINQIRQSARIELK